MATAATMSRVALPEKWRLEYADSLATGTLVAGGTLGILIPPSVVIIIYAVLAEQNITKLFAAAFVPGLLAALAVTVRLRPGLAPSLARRASAADRGKAIGGLSPMVQIFTVMLGGLHGGIFTPTEAAAVGMLATLALGVLRREIGINEFLGALVPMAQSTAMIFVILLGADVTNSALALTQVSARLSEVMMLSDISPITAIAALVVIYIILGSFLDEVAILVLTLPIVLPIVLGFDLFGLGRDEKAIWFGILILSVVRIGMIPPPVGLNLFVVAGLARDVPTTQIYRGVIPFLVADLVRITVLIAFPAISLGVAWMMR